MKKSDTISHFTTTIISGKYRGKKINIPAIETTRSSKSRVRESLFDTLQFDLMEKNFVEVFSGSGSVGLEALSRGAGECYFIEYNKGAYQTLVENIKKLDPTHCHHFFGDSFERFPLILELLAKSPQKSYFYFDPPFSTREGMESIYQKTLALIEQIDPQICQMVIIEHMSTLELPEQIGAMERFKQKKFGKSTLSYYRPNEDA